MSVKFQRLENGKYKGPRRHRKDLELDLSIERSQKKYLQAIDNEHEEALFHLLESLSKRMHNYDS